MKIYVSLLIILVLASCSATVQPQETTAKLPIIGTWQLISGTTIDKNDTTVTWYTKNISFIKVINESHFAFMQHDLNKGKDSANNVYVSGGGRYSLHDSTYTEHLEYCSDRSWEGHDFTFTISIHNDSLTQKGIEKIDSLGVNRLNIEKYVRVKN